MTQVAYENKDIQGMMASLLYLQQEMKKEGHHNISAILQNTMYQVDAVLQDSSCEIRIIDRDFFKILEFAHNFSIASREVRKEALEVIQSINSLCKQDS